MSAWLLERGDIMQIFKPNWSLCMSPSQYRAEGKSAQPWTVLASVALLTCLDVETNWSCSGQDAELDMQHSAGGGFLPSFLLLAC